MAAAAIIFFAFYGFDAIATAAEEAKNPSRDLAIGIVGSMLRVRADLHGGRRGRDRRVAYTRFADSPEPLALILREIGQPWAARILGASAVIALPTVILAFFYGQSRIFFTVARDGLLPPAWRACRGAGRRCGSRSSPRRDLGLRRPDPADRDRRAGQCRDAGRVRRGVRGDAGAARARAEPPSASSARRGVGRREWPSPWRGIVELAGQRRRAAAAKAVAHHHQLLDLELGDREFERRRDAVPAAVRLEGRDEVGDVADDEHLARPASKIWAGSTRLSEQAITITLGLWPSASSPSARARAPSRSRGSGDSRRGVDPDDR
jgi:hypothetical protein